MAEVTINGVAIQFPFKPYKVQEDYMAKVIECLQDGKNGVLESPTGTGKTLCLLCSSLAWLNVKKAQLQSQIQSVGSLDQLSSGDPFMENFSKALNKAGGKASAQPAMSFGISMPKIIYASRTHSQLTQVIQELKRTSYKYVSTTVLGSRDQLCINPEVAKEQNSHNKIHMCQAKVKARNCIYYNTVENRKDDPAIRQTILDIEDLMKTGQKYKCCPYYLCRELKQQADIIFMPYNYLLDPKTRKSQGIELQNNVILLDEAHNVEKICEEAASLQISSTDIAVCIEEITGVMKDLSKEEQSEFSIEATSNVQKDFSTDDLMILKTMFLELENAIDAIKINKKDEGDTFPGSYIFELLGKADISQGKEQLVIDKLDKIILYLTTTSTSPFARKGNALQKFCDLLRVVFAGSNNSRYRERIKQCYKVYIQSEPTKKSFKNDVWESKKMTKSDGKLISYWCFSPGFGMQQLLDQGVRCIILTSGTLSPLKPFISEIGINIEVQLENPHIVSDKQICVGIVSCGYDGFTFNSSFNTRNDPKYIASLGETIKILSCILPHGLLIFFPSYPIMKKCQEEWQKMGKWSQIEANKPIYVEPQSKENFNCIMNEYYKKIHDPNHKGAIFMAVCRGKVSEGLDFANANGRAVLITGLPFPPLKDPRVILKQRYLDENKVLGKESLTGQQWYQLEASRAVNQAIGRIIRHKDDFGAILLCDCRFDNPSFKQQLSSWLRPHIKKFQDFKMVLKEVRAFFRYTNINMPQPTPILNSTLDMSLPTVSAAFDTTRKRVLKLSPTTKVKKEEKEEEDNFDIGSYTNNQSVSQKSSVNSTNFASLLEMEPQRPVLNFSTCKYQSLSNSVVNEALPVEPEVKRRKFKIKTLDFPKDTGEAPCTSESTMNQSTSSKSVQKQNDNLTKVEQGKMYLKKVKNRVSIESFNTLRSVIADYQQTGNFDELIKKLKKLFLIDYNEKDLLLGFRTFVKKNHTKIFDDFIDSKEKTS